MIKHLFSKCRTLVLLPNTQKKRKEESESYDAIALEKIHTHTHTRTPEAILNADTSYLYSLNIFGSRLLGM